MKFCSRKVQARLTGMARLSIWPNEKVDFQTELSKMGEAKGSGTAYADLLRQHGSRLLTAGESRDVDFS